MKVRLITQNVQGLNAPQAPHIIRNFYQEQLHSLDILCLQEHKLRGQRLTDLGHQVWRDASFFPYEASVAYNHMADGDGAGSGGICTFVSPKLKHLVHSNGNIGCNLGQWIRLSGLPGGDLAILNIYAPHTPSDRMNLWCELISTLPSDCRWIVCGDWNMVLLPCDNSNPSGNIACDAERLVFTRLLAHLQVEDYFPFTDPIRFSWDSKRRTGIRTMKRLDRVYCYANPNGPPNTHVMEYKILGECAHSDHLPITINLEIQASQSTRSRYKMNGFYLQDKAVVVQLTQLWQSFPRSLGFFGKLRRLTKWYKEFCISQAKARRATESQLRHQIAVAQAGLQADPQNVTLQECLDSSADQLKDFEKWRVDGQQVRSRVKWRAKGDQNSREFFQAIRMRNTQSQITELQDPTGQVQTGQRRLEEICETFYAKLYSSRPASPEHRTQQDWALRGVSSRLTTEMLRALDGPLTLAELSKALKDMARGKSPGPDGVITELFQCLWPVLGEEYLQMLQDSVGRGTLPPGVTDGLITLLHKGGSRSLLNNWRPITLLNVSYKLFAKTLQLRLQPVLAEIISHDQSAFLPMRFILDNIFLTHETIAYAKQSGQPLLFLKLDFSKAYDKVDLTFLFSALESLGFPELFLRMTRLLFHNAAARVSLNGKSTSAFPIQQGVRQGCPLAPYLFLVVGEILNHTIKREVHRGRIKGIELPGALEPQTVAQYADDTSLTICGEEQPVRTTMRTLQSFSQASGLLINEEKSSAYYWHPGETVRPPWSRDFGWQWAESQDISKLLGAPFGLNMATVDTNQFLTSKIDRKLVYWCSMKLNTAGREVVVNNILISAMLYFLAIWGGSAGGVKKITAKVRNFY
jgi:exonuclease III